MKTITFKVVMIVPKEVSYQQAKEYVQDAVKSWGGQFHPDDPLFGLEERQVHVTKYVERRNLISLHQ